MLTISTDELTLDDIRFFINYVPQVELSSEAIARVERSRKMINDLVGSGAIVYGVNTGFGKFADVKINKTETAELQRRLVLSHAAGVGDPMPEDIVRLMMLLKIKNLSLGHSGVRKETVQFLVDMLNKRITPVIPSKGSVGASGDLAPLGHMAAAMLGEGQCFVRSEEEIRRIPASKALQKAGLGQIRFEAKEGLALLNGTQAIQAFGLWTLIHTTELLTTADIIGAMSLEALLGTLTAFDARIQQVRNHPGQEQTASNVRTLLQNSPIVQSHRDSDHKVQDAYSLRCIPQVHGAVRDGLQHVLDVFTREMNGVTDNPLIFPQDGEVLSGGNFHGQPLAMSADYLGILLAELAGISERRIEHMLDPAVSEMAGFLTKEGGLNSGFMIAQVTAAALVSENKVLTHPASVDSIPTSANKEDHVSMGAHAARKAKEILYNVQNVLAVELICACQALDLRAPLIPSRATGAVLDRVRPEIAHWKDDRFIHPDMMKAQELIHQGTVRSIVEEITGALY
ncbi:MAG: histidine ammonia-lyase [Caldithrix sp.]|nr:histidine ammonia-lyase [Caldithrix sp.]